MQNVGTPRFYVDWFSYAKAIGIDIPDSDQDYQPPVGINPPNIKVAEYGGTPSNMSIVRFGDNASVIKPKNVPINFISILGHNYGGRQLHPHFHNIDDNFNYTNNFNPDFTDICNWGESGTYLEPTYDGFSIAEITNMSDGTDDNLGLLTVYQSSTYDPNTAYTYKSGSCIVGNYYDMPHSPDLKLKLSYEYDGVKNIQTKGGATLSNAGTSYAATIGSETGYDAGTIVTDTDENYVFTSNILDGSDFFSRVWNRTMGGHLPFIFQPNKDNSNPDQFAIARFVGNSLQYNQVANNVYNVKLKIRECW